MVIFLFWVDLVRNIDKEVIEHISHFLRILVGFAIYNKLRTEFFDLVLITHLIPDQWFFILDLLD